VATFRYIALDGSGRKRQGIVEAATARNARFSLRKDGIYPVELQAGSPVSFRMDLWSRVRKKDVATFSKQLAALLEAGLPLVEALSGLSEQAAENRVFMGVVKDIREKVIEGEDLSEAISSYPKIFSPVFIGMVKAGESSGTLEKVLRELSELTDKEIAFRNRVQAVLAYPVLVSVVGTGIVIFLLAIVLPVLTRIFVEMSHALPLPTRLLISAGGFLGKFWWLIFVSLAAICWGLYRAVGTDSGRRYFDRLKLRLPVVGTLLLKSSISRFCRTFGTLIAGGVPILQSLDIARNVAGNKIISDSIRHARQDVKEGEGITNPLRKEGIFPPFALRLISSGETGGRLEEMLFKVSDIYDDEVSATVSVLSSLVEPIMIILMGIVVGFVVLAILLPIFEMNQVIK